ncbi:DUF4232 domain-containing protein [Streptomyces naganishii]|uniref:DUF4232 domain-containing protein n=1 Tax=Streptomyces naganishii JCM 4654 TaxID=1306179 RepID=A0A918YB52_9ACTN|nr:DUF4232 domain-containing protein [Streptomyces naganishii]GHD96473.1 hypothetical protein GCM10010508_65360 [Streptomyces naganishii JCM 4654]
MRAIPITVTVLAAALLLTACDSGGGTGGSDTGNKNSGSKSSGSKNTDSTTCRIGEVGLQVGPANAAPAAGDTGNVPVTLTNKGAKCTLEGFPTLSLTAQSASATVPRDQAGAPQKLTLAQGDTASFTLTYVRGKEGDPKSLAATSLKIGLPGAAEGQTFKWSYGPVQGKKDATDPNASVTAFQQAGD